MEPLAIVASGMVTSVGLTAPAACAAIRARLDRFTETHFMFKGEWLLGSSVLLEQPWRGREKLIQFAVRVIEECLAADRETPLSEIPLILCVAEQSRPGRFADLDESLLKDVQDRTGHTFHKDSCVISKGRVGGIEAMRLAVELIHQGRPRCLICGVDTFLTAPTLTVFEEKRRLLTSENSDGFIPGEAGAAVLLRRAGGDGRPAVCCLGLGFAKESATIESGEAFRGDGMVAAVRSALNDAGLSMADVDFRIVDVSGEQYGFKEAALVVSRLLRQRKEEMDIWHPADCVGEVGAAAVPIMLSVVEAASRKRYAPGATVLCHAANDAGERGAMVLRYVNGKTG